MKRLVPAIGIAILTVVAAVFFFALPDRAFSENENRTLAQAPAFSAGRVLDGSLMADFENYLADQFPMRDVLFSLSVRAERLMGRKEINGVLFVKEGDGSTRLIDVYAEPQNTEKFIAAVKRLADNLETAQVVLLPVPTAVTLYADELPAHTEAVMPVAQTETLGEIVRGVGAAAVCVDALPALAQAGAQGEEIFYRTDHHWTTRGALRVLPALLPALGLEAETPAGELVAVSDTFYGTTWSKVCDPSLAPDVIERYEDPAWEGRLSVVYTDTGEVADTPYNGDYLEKKDQYSMFLNNLHPFIEIHSQAAPVAGAGAGEEPEGKRRALAVVGDSYKNCLVPFLIDHYETIYVFDPRYYRGGISAFVNGHPEIGNVLLLYNLGTMDADRGIGAID